MSFPEAAHPRRELSIEDYLARVLSLAGRLPARTVPLRSAYGCVLAADLRARVDLPAFASSAMDGYAVRSDDLAAATPAGPVRLQAAGEVAMGGPAGTPVAPGFVVAVPTGGLMPAGADAVVPLEECTQIPGAVIFTRPVAAGRNVRPAGEDLVRGEVLVSRGTRLEGPDLAALAAGGHAETPVHPQPVVALLSTGDELMAPETQTEPAPGRLFESNSFLLEGLVRRAGGRAVYGGRLPDDPEALREACRRLAPEADLVLCSGGVSAGRNDPVRRAFEGTGQVELVRVAAQPGRPQACGVLGGKPFLGLPGNPMAALVSFLLFAAPVIRQLSGSRAAPDWVEATSGGKAPAAPAAVRFLPAKITRQGSQLLAEPATARRSNQLAALAGAGGLLEVPAGSPLTEGSPCRFLAMRDLQAF